MAGWRAAAAFALLLAACGGGGGGATDTAKAGPLRFGFWGDTPYTSREAQALPSLIEQMNDSGLDVSLFVGDIFGSQCDDGHYGEAADRFATFAMPLVYTPGDNEWTDCYQSDLVHHDSLERLAFIRKTFFPTESSLGRNPVRLEQQRPSYPENGRWLMKSVLFVTVNVPGSNDNHIPDPDASTAGDNRSPEERRAAEAEYQARDEADRAWLHDSFSVAARDNAAAVVVAMQADPGFDVPPDQRAAQHVDGFDRLLGALATEAKAFGKLVVLVHGDSHRFANDKPLVDPATGQPVPNVTRVETFGSPDVGWVQVTIDPADPGSIRVDQRLVRAR